MKRTLVVSAILIAMLLSACSTPTITPTQSTPSSTIDRNINAAISEIVSHVSKTASKYIEVDSVDREADYLKVRINLKYDPELYTNLEDGYKMAQTWTDAVAKSSVDILKKYDVDMDLNVWAKMAVGNNEWILFGKTAYTSNNNSYQWSRYKPS